MFLNPTEEFSSYEIFSTIIGRMTSALKMLVRKGTLILSILWISVLEWSHGVEPWSGVMECSLIEKFWHGTNNHIQNQKFYFVVFFRQ